MMNRRNLIFLLAAAALALAGIGTARALRRAPRGPFVPYTATYRVEDRAADGTLVGAETHVQWRNSRGLMHETRDDDSGRSSDTYGDPARGVFVTHDGAKLLKLNDPYGPVNKTPEEWRAIRGYVRDDVVAGIPAVVIEAHAGGGNGNWDRVWLAPSYGGLILQSETHMPTITTRKTLVTLTQGEPQRPVPAIPDLPVDQIHYPATPGR